LGRAAKLISLNSGKRFGISVGVSAISSKSPLRLLVYKDEIGTGASATATFILLDFLCPKTPAVLVSERVSFSPPGRKHWFIGIKRHH
jgi:hypothetical protein